MAASAGFSARYLEKLFRWCRGALLQFAFEISVFRRGLPSRQPEVAQQLAAFYELAFQEGASLRPSTALIRQPPGFF